MATSVAMADPATRAVAAALRLWICSHFAAISSAVAGRIFPALTSSYIAFCSSSFFVRGLFSVALRLRLLEVIKDKASTNVSASR